MSVKRNLGRAFVFLILAGFFSILGLAIASPAEAQTPNTISTYAGGGKNIGAATGAFIPQPYSAIRDTFGNTYISVRPLEIIYKVNSGGTISIFAGTGIAGFSGDGGAATSAQMDFPAGMAVDASGNLYFADEGNNRIRKVTASTGVISTLAGSGTEYNGAGFYGGFSGDGGLATDALLNFPSGVAVDSAGNLYIADRNNQVIRFVSAATGIITTYAGNGTQGYGGDTGPGTSAEFNQPTAVSLDSSGDLFIADTNNCIVRKVDTSTQHIVTTYAGTPRTCGFSGDSAPAVSAELSSPLGVYMDGAGNLLIADTKNFRIRRVDNTTQHDMSTVAGTGTICASPSGCGDGGAATSALLNVPSTAFEDGSGNILIADTGDMRVRSVAAGSTPTIADYAGGGNGGDGGPATSGMLALPYITNVDAFGNLFILDTWAARVQRVDASTKVVTTYAGNGVLGQAGGANGNGGAATAARFIDPIGMAIDGSGNVYVVDQLEAVVLEINKSTGNISTIAGNGLPCGAMGNPNQFPGCGDGGAAVSASLYYPEGVAVDSLGNVYISDAGTNRIRIVSDGTISNYAGTGAIGYSGDGGPATQATMRYPIGMTVDSSGDLYFADNGNNVIREINTDQTINTAAFTGEPTFGDGSDALSASMYNPAEVALDAGTNLFVGGGFDNVVQRVDFLGGEGAYGTVITAAGNVDNLDGGFSGDGGPSTQALLSNFGLTVDSNENLYIADAGNNRIRKVSMVPVASWMPSSLAAFPPTLQGQVSDPELITFSNSGLNDLTVNVQSSPADFTVTPLCPAAPSGTCDVLVELTPPAGAGTGPVSGNLILATNDPNHPTVTFALSGTVASTGFLLTVNEVGSGNVSSDPSGIICPTTCSSTFASGAVVTLYASSNPGYSFTGWSGPCTPSTTLPFECTVTMSAAETVTASFGAPALTVAIAGNGSGTIKSSPSGISCPPTCNFTFPAGTSTVTLSATANTGSTFVGWSDFFCSNESGNTCVLNLVDIYFNEQATAVFSVPRQPFTKGDVFLGTTSGMIFEYSPSGTLVQVLPSINFNTFFGYIFGMSFDANGNLYATNPAANAVEKFASNGTGPTAFANTFTPGADSIRIDPSGNVFVGLDTINATGNLLEFAGGENGAPTSSFFPAYYTFGGIGPFELTQDNVTILYTLAGNSVYSYNTQLGLQNPDLTDNLPGIVAYDLRQLPDKTILVADGDRVVRLSTTGAVIQTYKPVTFALLLGLTLDPDGVDFWTDDSITGIVYKINISSGAIVSQFSTGLAQNAFAGIVGLGGLAVYGSPASGGEDLTVSLAGSGAGTVSSTPAGISCPTSCTANFAVGSHVTLTAAAGTGSTFAGWSGACTGTGTCTVTMSAAQAVTATFNSGAFALTVTEAGTGAGTVTSSPVGIDCPATSCSANFASGTVVTLTAAAGTGSTFAGWSGSACGGTGSCVVTMSAAEAVTATFNTTTSFTLTVTEAGTGTGTVTSSPAGINCPATACSASFASDSSVTLTAAAGTSSTFAGWSGAGCSGTGTCVVTMSAAKNVTATFNSGGSGLTIFPTTLPNGAIGAAYGQLFAVTGATPPYNFSISSGTLPAGLNLGATSGSLGGVPTGPAGASSFTVEVTDSSGTPLTGLFNFSITIAAADTSNNAELNGHYAFVFSGFNDSDGTMVVVAASFTADGNGNITNGVEDADGSTGVQPQQTLTGTYTLGADNRGTMALTTESGTVIIAFSAGDIVSGIATKARFFRFDDVSGTNGHTGSAVMLKQDPTAFSLASIQGAYAFGESGESTSAGVRVSGVGFVNADGAGNFTPAGVVDQNAGGTVSSKAISGTYATTDATVSNGQLTASTTVAGSSGSSSDILYVISASQVIYISINPTGNVIYSGTAQLQTPPTGGFNLGSLSGNAVLAVQGTPPEGTSEVVIGAITFDGDGNFSMSLGQNNSGTFSNGTASGTYTVASNGRSVLTFTSSSVGSIVPAILYLDGQNQGFVGATDNGVSAGFLEPGGSGYSNATLSGKYFFGTEDPPSIQDVNESGVATFDGVGAVAFTTDLSLPGGVLLGDQTNSQTYTVASNGQLSFTGEGTVGYVASGCKAEMFFEAAANPTIGTMECQQSRTNETLTVTEAGTGTGAVTSNPSGINCPTTTCSASFASGTVVTLTATAGTGSTFAGWSGSGCSGTGTCVVTMSAAKAVTATFNSPTNFTLTVTEAGTGTGTVTSSPAGISCPATECSASFASGTVVTLTAAAGTGSTFAGWSGSGCSGTGTCVVTMSAAEAVTATFNSTTNFTLTVTEAGTGTGTVTSSPAGINCPATECSASFASGIVVTLTATAGSGSTFAGWSGSGCSGTGTCVVTMSTAEAVTATFNKTATNFALTVNEAGTGTGTVTSSPAGINCPTTCSANYASGTVVTLTAAAADGSTFAGWSGAGCSGTGTCAVTMNAVQAVTATFNSNSPVTIGIGPGGSSTGTTTPGGNVAFGLQLTSINGFSGTVKLSCSSISADITCLIVPSSINLTGVATQVAIVVTTYCKGSAPGSQPIPGGFGGGLTLMLAAMSFAGVAWSFKRRPRWVLSFGVLVLMAVGLSACSNLAKSPSGQATPPGSYPLTVTVTAPSGATSSINLTLNVVP